MSEKENAFEVRLIAELLPALMAPRGETAQDGITYLDVVVLHPAQRRLIHTAIAGMGEMTTGAVSVDTVERFQGDEREVMILSAIESDPFYLR